MFGHGFIIVNSQFVASVDELDKSLFLLLVVFYTKH